MTDQSAPASDNATTQDEQYEKLVEKLVKRVWQLWQQDLQQTRERRGTARRR